MRVAKQPKTIKLICDGCKNPFDKCYREYKNKIKDRQTRFFCSIQCLGIKSRREETAFNILFKNSKKNAKARHKDFDLDTDFIKTLWNKQKGRCAYTGLEMRQPCQWNDSSPFTTSIDRIDSGRGYFKNNVELVCMFINLGKRHFSKSSVQEFLKHMRRQALRG